MEDAELEVEDAELEMADAELEMADAGLAVVGQVRDGGCATRWDRGC